MHRGGSESESHRVHREQKMKPDTGYNENMTVAMLEALIDLEALKTEALFCHAQALRAFRAEDIHLPATAASGKPVLHGARRVMGRIKEYWIARRDEAIRLLPRSAEIDAWCDKNGFSNIAFGKLDQEKPS